MRERQDNRLPEGGRIDRTKPLHFSFDGSAFTGYAGDTLASALLAGGVRLTARSFKYHRPRGVMTAGSEEPNMLVRADGRPNLRATEIPLHDGLVATSQNRWPNRRFDVGAIMGLLSPFIGAGFYYKTFMAPAGAWPFYERFIRRAAGLGRAPDGRDAGRFSHRHAHSDVLVVGAGPAGLAAALAAARTGARTVICDERALPGGGLNWLTARIDGSLAADWAGAAAVELAPLTGTTAFAVHDGNLVLMEQRLGPADRCLWKLRARTIVLASGAVERPIVFPGNDRPGIMLASAVRTYVRQYAVRPGRRAVIVTNNDSGYDAIVDLAAAGIETAAVVELQPACSAAPRAKAAGIPLHEGARIEATSGRQSLTGITVAAGGRIACDLVCMAGGWTPSLQLYAQRRGRLRFDSILGAHVPEDAHAPMLVAGAAAGHLTLAECLVGGWAAGRAAAEQCGFAASQDKAFDVDSAELAGRDGSARLPGAFLLQARQRSFVDFQGDVTAKDIALAHGEGFSAIEHLKRYTTAGMGTDQGKTGNINALALAAELSGVPAAEIGHTTFRPPVSPVSFGAIAGEAAGPLIAPTRRTPFYGASSRARAVFVNSDLWVYPRYFPLQGESMRDAVRREVETTRSAAGMCDMSSLGKVDVQGADALAFIERVYCNNLGKLKPGKVRYSLMLREDGIVLDDGTVTCLAENHYLLTLTTAHSGRVWLHLEKLRQVHWPELDVKLASVTDHWASLALAGPCARKILAALGPDFDLDNEAFPVLSMREGEVAGLPARVFRVSFSGELGFEINVPAGFASALWQRLSEAGRPLGLAPYGLEALDVMRIEKGHVVIGSEIDGRTTPGDLGLERMVSQTKDFVGRALLARPALQAEGRHQFVGLKPRDGASPIPVGSQITAAPWTGAPQEAQGHLTASVFSPALGQPIALAMIADGRKRLSETVWTASPIAEKSIEVEIVPPQFYDPDGSRMRA